MSDSPVSAANIKALSVSAVTIKATGLDDLRARVDALEQQLADVIRHINHPAPIRMAPVNPRRRG